MNCSDFNTDYNLGVSIIGCFLSEQYKKSAGFKSSFYLFKSQNPTSLLLD